MAFCWVIRFSAMNSILSALESKVATRDTAFTFKIKNKKAKSTSQTKTMR
jgi:hypothetical protein